MNINRLEVSEIFDCVINDVDLRVEKFIIDNVDNLQLVNEINQWRVVWIKEIRECEAHCLFFLDNEPHRLSNEQRIQRYCFLVMSCVHTMECGQFPWRLISTDKYWTPAQVKCFQEVLNLSPSLDASLLSKLQYYRRKHYSAVFNALFLGVDLDERSGDVSLFNNIYYMFYRNSLKITAYSKS
jgi:hypothetical protein